MLKRISVLNSKVYGKAELRLDDCDSLQLVGPNNIGKSTLIYALNFLFIIDGQKMSFSGNRKGDKETIHHYFPTPNQSYIVFEIFKQGYYCILVKRDTDGELEYYRIESEYDTKLFFTEEDGHQKLLKFDEVKDNLAHEGISITEYFNKTAVMNDVYQRGTKNNAVIWLEDNVKSDGLSNNFSKVYRYLINSKLITNRTLKESLIIADNRENELLNFSQKNKQDIVALLKINDEIKNIKSVQPEFKSFREVVNKYVAKSKVLGELLYAYNKSYGFAIPDMENRSVEMDKEIGKLQTELNEVLKPKADDLNRRLGQKDADVSNKLSNVSVKQIELDEINSFEDEKFLNESLVNLDGKRKELELKITSVEQQNISAKEIESKITNLTNSVSRYENQVKNYKSLLIHKISDSADDRKLLNSILAEEISTLPAAKVKTKIKKASKTSLKVFDGEIDIKGIDLKEFKSIDEIKDELAAVKKEKKQLEDLLPIVKDIEKAHRDLAEINSQIEVIKEKLRKLKLKPELEKVVKELSAQLKTVQDEKASIEKEIEALKKEIHRKDESLESKKIERRSFDSRMKTLHENKAEIDSIGIEPIEFESSDSLEQLYGKIKMHLSDRIELKSQKDRAFDSLRTTLKSNHADEIEFINYIEDEIACLSDKEKSIDGLLASISTQFANPAYTLMQRYEEFKQFVYNKFNQKLSTTSISNIESLKIELLDNRKLLAEIKKIASIQELNGQMMMDFDQSENLKILNNYLDNQKKVRFEDLFDIELHLEIKGAIKKVDLADQVESDGTDRMIRLVIIMSIINRLAVNNQDNRIALFIDEVATIDKHNRPELVNFCKEHHFIPIFAAPDPVPGFNKYYFIYPSKGKITVNEKVNAVFAERNLEEV